MFCLIFLNENIANGCLRDLLTLFLSLSHFYIFRCKTWAVPDSKDNIKWAILCYLWCFSSLPSMQFRQFRRLTCLQISVCLYFYLALAVSQSLSFSETSLSVTALFILSFTSVCAQDGLWPLKIRVRFRFLGYKRRLDRKIIIIK